MTGRRRATRLALLAVLAVVLGLALGGCGVVHRGADSPAGSPAAAPIRQDDLTELTQSLSDAAALDDEVGTDMAADAGESSS